MKKIYILIIITLLIPLPSLAKVNVEKPVNFIVEGDTKTSIISWENPDVMTFSKSVLFRSNTLIEDYFTYEAVEAFCDKIYEGREESYTDTNLAENLPYYYILFSIDKSENRSEATVIRKNNPKISQEEERENPAPPKSGETSSLVGSPAKRVNEVTLGEAGYVFSYNRTVNEVKNDNSRRLALFIIVKSPHDLTNQDKGAISYFIDSGTPTTILLGEGERAGVLNSYLSVFDKLPTNTLEWQDVIKIANGRWPNQRDKESEEKAADIYFSAIYKREPNMDNPKDNAAVTVIAYGLRPADRNIESEKNAIKIYRSIFNKKPVEASDWDLVRAIAYSGAVR